MGGGSKVDAPKMNNQEKALTAAQTDLLKQQQALIEQQTQTQNLLAPYLYESAGLKPITDASGKITGFNKIANPMQDQLQAIQQGFLDRTQAALAGNLPVDPALIRQLGESGQTLNESLRRQLGTGYATSTPGMQALADFEQRKTEALDAARRGDLTTATQMGLGTGQFNAQQLAQFLSQTAGVSNLSNQNAQLLGQTIQGYGAAMQPYQTYSQLGFNANVANQQAQAQQMAGFGTLAGTLGGAALMSPYFPVLFGAF